MVWVVIIVGLVLIYFLVSLFFLFKQRSLIFEPKALPQDYVFDFKGDFEEKTIDLFLGSVNCLRFKVSNPKGCVMFHHGNEGNLLRWAPQHEKFTKHGYDVFVYDYRTYGKSKGVLTEKMLMRDAKRLHSYLLLHYKAEDIIQYGISLGTGIATKLSVKVNPSLLILETPYISMLEMANRKAPYLWNVFLLKFHIRTDKSIRKLKCPIYLFHGTDDATIPYKDSVILSQLNPNSHLTTIKGGHHSDLFTFEMYNTQMAQILG